MKMITAVVNKYDANAVQVALTGGGFSVTKLATSGGFLKSGNTTFLIGIEDDRLDNCLDIIKQYSSRRNEAMPEYAGYSEEPPAPSEVTVGGATVFVTNVERFEKF